MNLEWSVLHLWLQCSRARCPLANGAANGIYQPHTITTEDSSEKSSALGKAASTLRTWVWPEPRRITSTWNLFGDPRPQLVLQQTFPKTFTLIKGTYTRHCVRLDWKTKIFTVPSFLPPEDHCFHKIYLALLVEGVWNWWLVQKWNPPTHRFAECVTTPPPPSSSPGPGSDSMDMSPLPHKIPFAVQAQATLLVPEPTPINEGTQAPPKADLEFTTEGSRQPASFE